MTLRKTALLLTTHALIAALGFAAGIYVLPIWTAPDAPTREHVQQATTDAVFSGQFRRDLKGSDALHWGEGTVLVAPAAIALDGRLAPGPDYKLYLSPEFVETEADVQRLKPRMQRVGDVRTFRNFVVPVPPGVDVARYSTVVVWCETFSQFISAARYRPAALLAPSGSRPPAVQ